jgi:chromosome segregation protein
MQGFKSFADKIKLDFNSGITSVVGPNGSGKSNISDAIRWVLGEQSIKTLRGSKMEDVIFAGTEHRKPLGFAEVSITLDNSDSSLPIAYGEVTVTRRVFRSGESEYFINMAPCRLKDITELFLDTGIGRDGYSVIGQGRVDEILSTRSEDRRHIFEEASGIMKYKLRKQDAEKKLELTRQNLERINDIINELESQLVPLKEQSEAARKYLDIRESLKVLEVNVYLDSMERFREKLRVFEEQYNNVRNQVDTENKKLEEITASNKEKTDLLKAFDEKIEAARQQYYAFEGNLEKLNSDVKVNNEKKANLEQNIERLDTEISEAQLKMSDLDKEEAGKLDKIKYLEKQLGIYSGKLAEYEKQMDELLKTLSESERQIEEMKTVIMDKMDIQSDKKMQINDVKTHIDNIQKRQKSIDSEIYQQVIENDNEKMKKEDLTKSIRHATEELKKQRIRRDELTGELSESDKLLGELRSKQSKLRSEMQFKTSRARTLTEMEQNLEGYNRSVRQVLKECKESDEFGKGIHGALAQLIKVDKKI